MFSPMYVPVWVLIALGGIALLILAPLALRLVLGFAEGTFEAHDWANRTRKRKAVIASAFAVVVGVAVVAAILAIT